jgi:hypothetical protein
MQTSLRLKINEPAFVYQRACVDISDVCITACGLWTKKLFHFTYYIKISLSLRRDCKVYAED